MRRPKQRRPKRRGLKPRSLQLKAARVCAMGLGRRPGAGGVARGDGGHISDVMGVRSAMNLRGLQIATPPGPPSQVRLQRPAYRDKPTEAKLGRHRAPRGLRGARVDPRWDWPAIIAAIPGPVPPEIGYGWKFKVPVGKIRVRIRVPSSSIEGDESPSVH